MYPNYYRRPFVYRRGFGGGFFLPFALGGLFGSAITPRYYYPYYPYPYYY